VSNIAYNFAVGFDVGSKLKERAGTKKMAEGLLEYRTELEGGSQGALPVDEDPAAKLARMQQAEKKFYDGLTNSGLGMSEIGAAMQSFNTIKSGYVLQNGAEALGAWGTPAGTEAFKRTFEAMSPGDVKDIKVQTDSDGDPIYMVDFGEKDDDGDAVYTPFDRDQMEQLYAGASQDPAVLLAFDKNAREANEFFAEYMLKSEEHEAELENTAASTEKYRADATLAGERATTEVVERGQKGASEGRKMAQSRELADDLLDYDSLSEFRETNGGTFDAVFSDAYDAIKAATGVAPTRRQVLDALQASMPTEE
jgi:hypothetical protein